MILLYILGVLLALLLLYILFLGICCLFIDPDKAYEKNSPFYRFLFCLPLRIIFEGRNHVCLSIGMSNI